MQQEDKRECFKARYQCVKACVSGDDNEETMDEILMDRDSVRIQYTSDSNNIL